MTARLNQAADTAFLLFGPALGVGAANAFMVGSESGFLRAAVAGSVPAAAALLFSLLAIFVPSLAPSGQRLSALSLPIVFAALMVTVAGLVLSSVNPLTRIPEPLSPLLGWLDWKLVGATAVIQAGLLALRGKVAEDR